MELVQGSILERVTRLEIGSGLLLTQNADGIAKVDFNPAVAITQEYADTHYVQKIGDVMSGPLRVSSAYGWTLGNISAQARITYGGDAAGAFSLIKETDGWANLYLYNLLSASQVQVGLGAVGSVRMTSGGGSNIGFIEWWTPASVRQGYMGFGASGIALVMEVGNFNLNGRTMASASIGTQGQLRAMGWYTAGDLAGLAAEIGVSAGTVYFLGYNRTSSVYANVYLQGLNVHLSPQGGTSYIDGDGTGNTNPGSPTSYWLRFQYSSADRFSIGADASYVYLQSWASLPLYLNSQGNPIYFGGKLMSQLAGASYGQGNTAPIEIRGVGGGGNSLIWGHSNTNYIHSIGTLYSGGFPYIAFHAYQSTGDGFNRLGGSTIPFLLDYTSTGGYLQFFWGTAGTTDTVVSFVRKHYFGPQGDLGIEGSLWLTGSVIRIYDDGTYLNFAASPGRSFYVNGTFPVTYIYSANIFLGNTSGASIHFRQNVLYFGASDQNLLYSTDVGPTTYGTFRIAGVRAGYSGFYYDDWAYYLMNHSTIFGQYSPSYGWRWRFEGGATDAAWDLAVVRDIPSARNIAATGTLNVTGGSLVNDITNVTGWFRSSTAAGWFNSLYSVGIYATAAGQVRTYNGAGFYSEAYLQAASWMASGSYIVMPAGSVFYPDGGGDTYFYEASANQPAIVAGGQLRWRIVAGMIQNYSSDTSAGGHIFYSSASVLKGRVYWDSTGIGFLNDTDAWSIRANLGSGLGGTLFGAWSVGSLSIATSLSISTTLSVTGTFTALGAVDVSGAVRQKKGTSTLYDTPTVTISSSAAPASSTGYPAGHVWIQVTAPV